MRIIVILLLIILSVGGIGGGIYATLTSRSIFLGSETSWKKRLTNAAVWGFSVSMVFMCTILVVGLLDPFYVWTITNILSFALLSLIPGVIAFFGASWQFITNKWYLQKIRNLVERQKKRMENEIIIYQSEGVETSY